MDNSNVNQLIENAQKSFLHKKISIISQNCIGGVFYHDMNEKFLSPTINLYFDAYDFLKFVKNISYYLSLDIKIIQTEPIMDLCQVFRHIFLRIYIFFSSFA